MLKRTTKLILYLIVSSFIISVLVEKTSGNPDTILTTSWLYVDYPGKY